MLRTLAIVVALSVSSVAHASRSGFHAPKPSTGTGSKLSSTRVAPSVSKNGVYTPPHSRSTPDASKSNNWSTKGNVNPYTGKKGSK